jgi:hypothetical protein
MMCKQSVFVGVAGVLLNLAPAWAVVVGTTDNFEDGTFQGWGGAADQNVSTGGPAGSGDHYLRASSGTFGVVPNLASDNEDARWAGSYTGAGVTRLEADLKILNGPDLQMRATLFGGTSAGSRVTSSTALVLPADGLWHHLSFNITAGALTSVAGIDPVANVLQNVNRIQLRHQSGAPTSGGTPVSAQVGFDNITVTPEPTAGLGFLTLLTAWAARRKR